MRPLVILFLTSLLANLASCALRASATESSNEDHLGYFFWKLIPSCSRSEIVDIYEIDGEPITFSSPSAIQNVIDSVIRNHDLSKEQILAMNSYDHNGDWFITASTILITYRSFSLETKIIAVALMIENAPTEVIKRVFKEFRYCREYFLQRIPKDELVLFVIESFRPRKETIEIFKIIQMFTDYDITSNLEDLKMIRKAGFKKDNQYLLEYVDDHLDIIEPSYEKDGQSLLMESWLPNSSPKLFKYICSKSAEKSPECSFFPSDKFFKFRIFSEPVNVKDWNVAMFAVASREHDLVLDLPKSLLPKATQNRVHMAGNHITCMEHLIPMIDDSYCRRKLSEIYNLQVAAEKKTSFETTNEQGQRCTVRVIRADDEVVGQGNTFVSDERALTLEEFFMRSYWNCQHYC